MTTNANITHVTDDTFAANVEQAKGLVVVDFWAEWCGPCRAIAPILEDLATSYAGRVQVAKLDVDANQRTSMRFNVRSIPTLLFFRDGKHVDTVVGLAQKSVLQQRIDKHLAAAA
jgi:thioredoxin 1